MLESTYLDKLKGERLKIIKGKLRTKRPRRQAEEKKKNLKK